MAKDKAIQIRLSAEQLAHWNKCTQREGTTVSEAVRQMMGDKYGTGEEKVCPCCGATEK